MEWAPTLLLRGGFPSSIPLRGTTAFWFVVDAHGLNLGLGLHQIFFNTISIYHSLQIYLVEHDQIKFIPILKLYMKNLIRH